jgi:hypothetical protein
VLRYDISAVEKRSCCASTTAYPLTPKQPPPPPLLNAGYQQQQNGGSGDEESGLLGGLNSAVSEGMNNLRQGMPTLSLKDSSPPVLFGLDCK